MTNAACRTRPGASPRTVRFSWTLAPVSMNRSVTAFFALVLLLAGPTAAQPVTGLQGWNLVLDPGHSFQQNAGAFGYSEAEKVLAVGLELRRLMLATTDVDTVYMTRTANNVEVGLQQRVDYANLVGGAYFHSIHSNAADASATSLFILWPQDPATLGEPPAAGGRRTATIMGPLMARAMRIPAAGSGRGEFGECEFYGVSTCRTLANAPKASRNFIQSFTVMPSTLSEAGFHTNPTQNQRNMNADWKRMEARAMYWSFLKTRNVARPATRIVMGIVSDVEGGLPVNGASVEAGGKTYTTDTHASLFNRYSQDPNELRNGFYYLEDVPGGASALTAAAPGFEPFAGSVTPVDSFFTFADVRLVSSALPVVALATATEGQTGFRVVDPIDLVFSRPMNRATVEAAFALAPAGGGAPLAGTFAWSSGDRRVRFDPAADLDPFTAYVLTVGPSAASPFGYALDGNRDGAAGDAYALRFTTGPRDVIAPAVAAAYPASNARDRELDPLIAVTFDELVERASATPGLFTLARISDGAPVAGTLQVTDVTGRTVVHFAPAARLDPNTFYRFRIDAGLKDVAGNRVDVARTFNFRTGVLAGTPTAVETFDGDFVANWWTPLQSGSTTQTTVVGDSTRRDAFALGNPLTGSAQSMRVRYGWKTDVAGPWLIREYLNAGPAFTARFDTSSTLQAYVFGDGSGTQVRFAVDDNVGAANASTEVSPWTTVDWRGWRRVEWDLGSTPPGAWIGNGIVEGALRFDSFQLTYNGGAAFGSLLFDDLRVVKYAVATANESEGELPSEVAFDAAYPNPFAGTTRLAFRLPSAQSVSLVVYDVTGRAVATLASGQTYAPGAHTLAWDGSNAAAGVYFARLTAGGTTRTVSLVRVR